jgi:hypothetical protein
MLGVQHVHRIQRTGGDLGEQRVHGGKLSRSSIERCRNSPARPGCGGASRGDRLAA